MTEAYVIVISQTGRILVKPNLRHIKSTFTAAKLFGLAIAEIRLDFGQSNIMRSQPKPSRLEPDNTLSVQLAGFHPASTIAMRTPGRWTRTWVVFSGTSKGLVKKVLVVAEPCRRNCKNIVLSHPVKQFLFPSVDPSQLF